MSEDVQMLLLYSIDSTNTLGNVVPGRDGRPKEEIVAYIQYSRHALSYRIFGWIVWILAVLIHLASNATLGFIIPLLSYQRYLMLLRVFVLDGLMLITSIAMAAFITLVITLQICASITC